MPNLLEKNNAYKLNKIETAFNNANYHLHIKSKDTSAIHEYDLAIDTLWHIWKWHAYFREQLTNIH